MNQTPIHIGPRALAEFAKECEESLLSGVHFEFIYPDDCSLHHWPLQDIKDCNLDFLNSLHGRANVYALFVRQAASDEWMPVYVGQRKSKNLRDRLVQHLISKGAQTGSMLEAVRTAVAAGERIGVSFIKVEPESLRLFVEETIISVRKSELPWNTHG